MDLKESYGFQYETEGLQSSLTEYNGETKEKGSMVKPVSKRGKLTVAVSRMNFF